MNRDDKPSAKPTTIAQPIQEFPLPKFVDKNAISQTFGNVSHAASYVNDKSTIDSIDYDDGNENNYGILEILSNGENLDCENETHVIKSWIKSDEMIDMHDNEHNAEIESNFHIVREIVVESNVEDRSKDENNKENADDNEIEDEKVRVTFCFD